MKALLVPMIMLGFVGLGASYGAGDDFVAARIDLGQVSYSHEEGTRAAVTVTDHAMNMHPNAIEYVWISVHSDSDPDLTGQRMPLFETGLDSGTFEGEIVFVASPPSGRGFLHVSNGDTITVKYVATKLPDGYALPDSSRARMTEGGMEVTATGFVGKSGPPFERAPASNPRLLNMTNEPISSDSVSVGQQISVVADLKNQQNRTQPFAYLIQIKNEQSKVESLSWLTGNLTASQKMIPSVTWIPFKDGSYTATIFVWQSINNPTALSPPVTLEITVR